MQCPQPYLICNLGNPQTGIVARSSEDFEFFLLLIFSSNTGLLDFIMDSEEAVEGATLAFLRNFILDLLPLPPRLGVPGLVYNTKTFSSDQYCLFLHLFIPQTSATGLSTNFAKYPKQNKFGKLLLATKARTKIRNEELKSERVSAF